MKIVSQSRIFLRKHYGAEDYKLLQQILNNLADEVTVSKDKRSWMITKKLGLFAIEVIQIGQQEGKYQKELENLNMLPEDAIEVIYVQSNAGEIRREQNYNYVDLISKEIVEKLGGITNGPRYLS